LPRLPIFKNFPEPAAEEKPKSRRLTIPLCLIFFRRDRTSSPGLFRKILVFEYEYGFLSWRREIQVGFPEAASSGFAMRYSRPVQVYAFAGLQFWHPMRRYLRQTVSSVVYGKCRRENKKNGMGLSPAFPERSFMCNSGT
jgi:hypothetical protein